MALTQTLQSKTLTVEDYNLSDTLNCGQAFRWRLEEHGWVGVIGEHWIQVSNADSSLTISTTHPSPDWALISDYFQIDVDIATVTSSFPQDAHLPVTVETFKGLRLLRQPEWECLASFILSSTKQIPHIQEIIERIASAYGKRLPAPNDALVRFTFPSAETLSQVPEKELRTLGMGYRARYLHQAARSIAKGQLRLQSLESLSYEAAKQALQTLHGVGPKIADCVLLFAYGMQSAFPIDVWVRRGLAQLYFEGQHTTPSQLEDFASNYFGPHAGYAQQYLFHYMRTQGRHSTSAPRASNFLNDNS